MAQQPAAGFPDDEFTVTGDPGQIAAVTANLRAIGQHCVECAAELRRVRPGWVAMEEVTWSFLRDSRYEEILRAGSAYAQAAAAFGPFGTQLADLQRRMALVRQDAEAAYARLQSAQETLVSDGAKAAVELVAQGPAALGSATQQAVGRDKAAVDAVEAEYEALRSQAQALRSEAQSDAARCAGQLDQIDRPGGTPAERAAAFQAEQAAKAAAAKEANKSGWQSFVDFVGDAFARSGEAQVQQAEAELEADREIAQQVGNGVSWAVNRAADSLSAVREADGVVERTKLEAEALLCNDFAWLKGDPARKPSVVEHVAAGLMLLGTSAGAAATTLTGQRLRFFDTGQPWVGTPSVTLKDPVPTNFATLTAAAVDSYHEPSGGPNGGHGQPRVVAIRKPGAPTRYVVSIPGTEVSIGSPRGWEETHDGRPWPANIEGMAFHWTPYTEATAIAINKTVELDQAAHGAASGGRPEILLTGHSQGGIIAQNIAANPGFAKHYSVRGVVTYGSPNVGGYLGDTPVLALQHGDLGSHTYERDGHSYTATGGDPVPWTDLNLGNSSGTVEVRLPPPDPLLSVSADGGHQTHHEGAHGHDVKIHPNIIDNHDRDKYLTTIQGLGGDPLHQIQKFERDHSLQDFYADPSADATVYVAPAGTR